MNPTYALILGWSLCYAATAGVILSLTAYNGTPLIFSYLVLPNGMKTALLCIYTVVLLAWAVPCVLILLIDYGIRRWREGL